MKNGVPTKTSCRRTRYCAPAAAVTLAILALSVAVSAAGAPEALLKLSPDLKVRFDQRKDGETVRLIVVTHGRPSPADRRNVRSLGGTIGRDLGLIDGFAAEAPLAAVAALAADARVRHVAPDRRVRVSMDVAASSAGAAASRGSYGPTGAGIGVAVVDSGVFTHEDLPGLAAYVDFVEPHAPFSSDPFGHGTHVAGIIAASPRAGAGRALEVGGIAPAAQIVSLRVLDRTGEGNVSDVVAALGWAVAHRAEHNIRIVNLSLGHPVHEPAAFDPLDAACEQAWRAGILVVASAGNLGASGNGTVSSPGNDPLVLTVGALDDHDTVEPADDDVSYYSSRGPTIFDLTVKPDVVAPGHRIVSLRSPHSTLDVRHPELRVALGGGPRGAALEARHLQMSGASMAAAVVSGVAALMIEADPALTPDTVKARLMAAARRLDGAAIFDRGAGAVDAAAAIETGGLAVAASSPRVLAAEGAVVVEPTEPAWGSGWSLEDLYGDAVDWDAEVISRNGFLDDPCATGSGYIWQDGFIWQDGMPELNCTSGAGTIWKNGFIWQDGYIWQDGFIWQDSILGLDPPQP